MYSKVFRWLLLSFIFIRPFFSSFAFRKFDLIFAIIFIILTFIYLKLIKRVGGTKYDFFFFIFILTLIASSIFSSNPVRSFKIILTYIFYISIFYFTYFEEDKDSIFFMLIVSGLFLSFYALYMYFLIPYTLNYLTEHQLRFPFAEEFLSRKRAFYPFVLPNLLGGYLTMLLPLGVGGFLREIKKEGVYKGRLVFICISIGFYFILLLLTKSLGAWVSLFSAVVIFFLARRRITKKSITLIVFFVLMIGAIFFARQRGELFTTPLFSLERRISYWQDTLKIVKEHPFSGVGLGNFYLRKSLFAHNSYLQLWAEAGVFAFLSYLGIIFLFLKKSWEKIKKGYNGYSSGIFIGGLSFIIHNLIDFSFFSPQVSFLWWMILAFAIQETGSFRKSSKDNKKGY